MRIGMDSISYFGLRISSVSVDDDERMDLLLLLPFWMEDGENPSVLHDRTSNDRRSVSELMSFIIMEKLLILLLVVFCVLFSLKNCAICIRVCYVSFIVDEDGQ